MRFLLPSVLYLLLGFISFGGVSADLRYASTPQNRFAVRNRDGSVAFSTSVALYMEPSDFGYQGLKNQRKNNYDNFLRSNIDNEQDNRNFVTEPGKDHLPFRTLEAAVLDATKQLPNQVQVVATPGVEYVLPLRWNNPHASELELNIWIVDNTIVVPIKKPVCAGEGYQDGVVSFRVPTDFNDLGSKVVGFKGCNKPGDCTLQLYAHSVEPRTYASGVPIIVTGFDAKITPASSNSYVAEAAVDPGSNLSKQPYDTCLSSSDPSSHHQKALPRKARYVSDVYNHAYQNSDYSPYQGQQQDFISRNLQAATVLRMVNGNRGELGKSVLTKEQTKALQSLRNNADQIVKNYETMTNRIINQLLKNSNLKTTGKIVDQQLNNCFRCAEAGSVSATRLETNTYVPSFKITDAAKLEEARKLIQQTDAKYSKLISSTGVVQIYVQALADLSAAYENLRVKYGLTYQTAKIKPSAATLVSKTLFRKLDANNKADQGQYATSQDTKTTAAPAVPVAKSEDPVLPASEGEDGTSYTFNGMDSSQFGLELNDVDLMTGNEIQPLALSASEILAINADDGIQVGYNDREDKVEALPIAEAGTDAELAKASSSSSESSSNTAAIAAGAGAGVAGIIAIVAIVLLIQEKNKKATTNTNGRVFSDVNMSAKV